MDIVGHRTLYKCCCFRSRGEARWAATCDGLNWPWLFEPVDLKGYTPDIIVQFPERPVLIEVKAGALNSKMLRAELPQAAFKVRRSRWGAGPALVLGAGPLERLGVIGYRLVGDSFEEVGVVECPGCQDVTLVRMAGDSRCVWCRLVLNGADLLSDPENSGAAALDAAFNAASTMTMWRDCNVLEMSKDIARLIQNQIALEKRVEEVGREFGIPSDSRPGFLERLHEAVQREIDEPALQDPPKQRYLF